MLKKEIGKSIVLTSGSALALSMALSGGVHAEANPFQATDLGNGYMQLAEAKCGEGRCGGSKAGEAKCGEAKCGGAKASEAKCGEGRCGGSKASEAKCGEGKCGEGKCGGNQSTMDRMIGK